MLRFLASLALGAAVILGWFAQPVSGTTLSYQLAAHEKACFYAWSDRPGQKVNFYFAVQSGGSFDIDYTVSDPANGVVLSGQKERQGDFVFSTTQLGEYSFCFSNGMSTFTSKLVDIDITMQDERAGVKAEVPGGSSTPSAAKLTPLEDSLYKLGASLSNIARTQKYFRTREHRNMQTVDSTTSRIYWFSVFENLLIVGMASLQVFVVRNLFNKPGVRGRV